MKMILFPLLFLLTSCSKVYDVQKKNSVFYIPDVDEKITYPRDVDWEVGKQKEAIISKGIRFASTVPRISQEGMETLRNAYGVDSWLIRVNRTRRGNTQAVGYFFIHLHNLTRNTKDFTINLYYHAASVSKRFRMFHCPAFEHRFKITDYEIENRTMPSNLDLFVRPTTKFPGKVSRLRFAPMVLSGGRSLQGIYNVDIALYNSKSKMIFSNWHPIGGTLIVNSEVMVPVASCNGVREENVPLPQSKMPSIKDLEIK